MKYIWAVLVGLSISFLGMGLYVGNVYSMIVPILILTIVSAISQFIYKKIDIIISVPILCMIVIYIYIFINNIDFISIDSFSISNIVYFILMLIFSINLRKVKQNYTFGIRTSYALEYSEVWDKTHMAGSVVIAVFLPMIFTLVFWGYGWYRFWLGNACVLAPIIITVFYSNFVGAKYYKAAVQQEKIELKIQNEIELGYRRKK